MLPVRDRKLLALLVRRHVLLATLSPVIAPPMLLLLVLAVVLVLMSRLRAIRLHALLALLVARLVVILLDLAQPPPRQSAPSAVLAHYEATSCLSTLKSSKFA